jgi:hypothetical protein
MQFDRSCVCWHSSLSNSFPDVFNAKISFGSGILNSAPVSAMNGQKLVDKNWLANQL